MAASLRWTVLSAMKPLIDRDELAALHVRPPARETASYRFNRVL